MSGPELARVFFALLPDKAVQDDLQALMASLPAGAGRVMAIGNLHLTLAFIGASDPARLSCLQLKASQIEVKPMTIRLDRLGHFDRGRVLWVGPERPDPVLHDLVTRLGDALGSCDYSPAAHQPFRAHVTLSRGAHVLPEVVAVKPILWRVRQFFLMVSRPSPAGVHYEVLSRYPGGAPVKDGPL